MFIEEILMNLSKVIKPISYLKSHTAEIFKTLEKSQQPMIITQNGEAKAVIQDIHSYESTQESIALLKVLTQSTNGIKQGKSKPVKKAFADIGNEISKRAK